MAEQNDRKGTLFLIAAMLVFAGQDGIELLPNSWTAFRVI